MTPRVNIFAKFFFAFCVLSLAPLIASSILLVVNYQEMTELIRRDAGVNVPPEMLDYVAARVAQVSHDAYLLMALMLVIGIVVVLFASLLFSRQFTRPITSLLQTANALGSGDFDVRLKTTRGDEFGALATGFNRMADQLEESQRGLERANADLERRVAERTAELEMTNLQLRATTAKTEEALRVRGEFLANLSHELRTPLHAVLGYAQLALDGVYGQLTPHQASAVGRIRENAESLRRLVNNIVDLLQAETGRLTLAIEIFDPRDTIEAVVNSLRPLFAVKGLAVSTEFAADLPRLQSDRGKLQIVLYNLLANALKFTPQGSVALRARATRDNAWFTIEVADTGPGIPTAQLSTIFESFRQLDGSTTREAGGAGIGLSLTKQLVDLLGGDIEVESAAGQGSVFRVTIPAVISVAPDRQSADPADPPSRSAPVVLSIDDDPDLLELLSASLEPAGYRVVTSTDGADGLAKARALRPYAVTLDIKLPKRDGWSILEELRRDPTTSAIPVLILTVVEDRAAGERYGANAYLTKPFNREQLIEHLDKFRETDLQ